MKPNLSWPWFLLLCVHFAASLTTPAAVADEPTDKAESRKPHIVVLIADDHSAADMSVYGAAEIPTPHLDRMAARVVRGSPDVLCAGLQTPHSG